MAETWCLRAHVRTAPNEHNHSHTKLQLCSSVADAAAALQMIPSADEFFRQHGKRAFLMNRELQGYSFFIDDVLPEWEHERNDGGEAAVFTSGRSSLTFYNMFQALVIGLIHDRGVAMRRTLGVKLLDKSNKNFTSHRLEIWFMRGERCAEETQVLQQLQEHIGKFTYKPHPNVRAGVTPTTE